MSVRERQIEQWSLDRLVSAALALSAGEDGRELAAAVHGRRRGLAAVGLGCEGRAVLSRETVESWSFLVAPYLIVPACQHPMIDVFPNCKQPYHQSADAPATTGHTFTGEPPAGLAVASEIIRRRQEGTDQNRAEIHGKDSCCRKVTVSEQTKIAGVGDGGSCQKETIVLMCQGEQPR